jgi:hypothetical protein
MKEDLETLAEQVLDLPATSRAWLAELLLESLDFEDFPVSAAWRKEIERRCQTIDQRKVELIPAPEVLSKERGFNNFGNCRSVKP